MSDEASGARDSAGALEATAYVGTYTEDLDTGIRSGSQGISCFRFDGRKGSMRLRFVESGVRNPTYLAIGPGALYAASEHRTEGRVVGFTIGAHDRLTLNSSVAIPEASATCHIALDPNGGVLYATNYYGGGTAAIALLPSGELGEIRSVVQEPGSSIVAGRQDGPHPHSATPAPGGDQVVVADLGADRLYCYSTNSLGGMFGTKNGVESVPVAGGEGPRSFLFDRSGRHAYLLTELGGRIYVYDRDSRSGRLRQKQVVSAVPEEHRGEVLAAHLAMTRNGRYLIASTRISDTVSVFSIDRQDGRIELVEHVSSGGRWPRHFCFGPGDRTLIVANQLSDSIDVFAFDPETGAVGRALWRESIPSPAFVALMTAREARSGSRRGKGGQRGRSSSGEGGSK